MRWKISVGLLSSLVFVAGCPDPDGKDDSTPCVGFECTPTPTSTPDTDVDPTPTPDTPTPTPPTPTPDTPTPTPPTPTPEDTGPFPDTTPDTGPDTGPPTASTVDTGPPTASTVDTGPTGPTTDTAPEPPRADDLTYGQLIITEFNPHPANAFCGSAGEYIELYNNSGIAFDVQGLIISTGSGSGLDTWTVTDSYIVQPGEYFVAQRNVIGGACGYTSAADFTYEDVSLANTGDLLQVSNAAGLIDEVDYNGWTTNVGRGRTSQLQSPFLDADGNDNEDAWCLADDTQILDPFGTDAGSPDEATTVCWVPPVNDTFPDTFPDTGEGDGGGPVGCVGVCLDDVVPGSLFITELMLLPAGCPATAEGRYFEIYNNSADTIDLRGLQFDWGFSAITTDIDVDWQPSVRSSPAIQPGESIMIARDATTPCHGIDPAFTFDNDLTAFGQPLTIKNASGGLHTVDFSVTNGFVLRNGRATGFDPALYGNFVLTSNSDNWCLQTTDLPASGDKGTPGALNDSCPIGGTDTTDTFGDTGPEGQPRDESDGLDAEELVPGDVVITEVNYGGTECTNADMSYLELYNNSGHVIRLDGLIVDVPGQGGRVVSPVNGSVNLDVQPGEYTIISRTSAFGYCWNATVPRVYRISAQPFLVGEFQVRNSWHQPLDLVDLSALPPRTEQSTQFDGTPDITANDDIGNWCYADPPIQNPNGHRGTPTLPTVCEVQDTGNTVVDRCDDGIIEEGEGLPGDVIINEVMFDPTQCNAQGGQYIEVIGNAECNIRLEDFRLNLGTGSQNVAISVEQAGYELANGDVARVYRTPSPGRNFCGTITPEYSWPRNSELFTGDSVSVLDTPTLVDAVDFTTYTAVPGFSIQFDPSILNGAGDPWQTNDDWEDWCRSDDEVFPGATNFGTPGLDNVCTRPPQLFDTGPTDVEDPVDAGISELEAGDLIITELMELPRCGLPRGQYVEIYNNTDLTLDLEGLELDINGTISTLPADTLAEPGEYLVFVREHPNRCYQGDFDIDFVYSDSAALVVGGNEVAIRVPAALAIGGSDLTVDLVDTRPSIFADWPGAVDGQSRQLNDETIDANLNNNPANWCVTSAEFEAFRIENGVNDYGTPGAANNPCLDNETGVDTGTDSFFFPDTFGEGDPDTAAPVDNLEPGDLIITELLIAPTDCADEPSAEYLEIYNNSGRRVNLDEITIRDSDTSFTWTIQLLVEPGEFAVVVNTPSPGNTRCYDLGDDLQILSQQGDAFDNIGDLLTLETSDGTVIDEVDFRDWPLSLGRAWELDPAGYDATTNDDVSNWCLAVDLIPGAVTDRGTPGRDGTGCAAVDEDPAGAADIDTLAPGDLVITEVMIDPADPGCSDNAGEYFELYNASSGAVNLEGLRVSNRLVAEYEFVIDDDIVVEAGAYAVLARFDNPRCYDIGADGFYGVVRLDNNGDVLRISNASGAIDVVDFRSDWPLPPNGAAWELDEGTLTATGNDDPAMWCPSLTAIPAATNDEGSPGEANGACFEDTGSLDIIDTGRPPPPEDTSEGLPGTDPTSLNAGDLIITEIMADPYDCPDGRAEYIELFNTTSDRIDLDGIEVVIDGTPATVVATGTIAGRGYAVGVLTNDTPRCYNLAAEFSYSGVTLPNDGGTVSVRVGGTVLDTVDYGAFGDQPVAASWTLQPSTLTGSGNDDPYAWCTAPDRIPGAVADRGTPGFANVACSVDPVDTGDTDTDTEPLDTARCLETGDVDACIDDVRDVEDLRVGDLVITEFFVDPRDCPDTRAEYIEVYNNTADFIDLNGLLVSNGSLVYPVDERLPLVVPPETYSLVGLDAVNPCYSTSVDVPYRAVALGPDDVVFIGNGATIIDFVDYSGFPDIAGRSWGLDPSRVGLPAAGGITEPAEAAATYTGSYINDDLSHWCVQYTRIQGSSGDKGTPGEENDPVCLLAGETPPYGSNYVADIDELDGGELVVTELMVRPDECSNFNGQFMEIRNDATFAIALDGLVVSAGANAQPLSTNAVIQPGGYLIGRRNSTTGGCYSGVTADFVYGVPLTNAGDLIELRNAHSVIDTVDTTGWQLVVGSTIQLDPDSGNDADANDAQSAWCFADVVIPGATTDVGTPGTDNLCATGGDTGLITVGVGDLVQGDLVVTEFMAENNLCSGGFHQYVELYNTLSEPVQLLDLIIEADSSGGATVNDSFILEPGEYALGVANVPSPCLVVGADFFYSGVVQLRPQDTLRIRAGALLIDEVAFGLWDSTNGNARMLREGIFDTVANDDEANWCWAEQPFVDSTVGGTVGGTPGGANDCSFEGLGGTDTGPEPVDTGLVRFAEVQGSAVVAAGALYQGEQNRIIGVRTVANQGRVTPDCFWQYTQNASSVANVASSCPTCQFAFETQLSGATDLMVFNGLGPSQCGTLFDPWGGVGNLTGTRTIALSLSYGAVLYDYNGSGLQVLTYDYSYDAPAGFTNDNFRWVNTLYTIYY